MTTKIGHLSDTQTSVMESALAVTVDQIKAVAAVLKAANFDSALRDDPAVFAATLQAISTNYLATITLQR